jgi:hypothetical protein
MKKTIFLVLAILGFIAPYYFISRFLFENRFNTPLLFQQLFLNAGTTAFAVDLVISVLAFWAFVFIESSRLRMKNAWLYLIATLLVGLSFAFPLFLYFRERKLEAG